jgi:hypothetical protein
MCPETQQISSYEPKVDIEQENVGGSNSGNVTPDIFPTAEPYVGEVDYSSVYDDLVEYFKSHVDLTDERHYYVLASWTFATYQLDKVPCTPHLSITGRKGTGKTRLLETLSRTVYRGYMPMQLTYTT